jgi:hypothetical protein
MTQVTFNFTLTLDDKEFIKVEDEIYTTRHILAREEPNVHLIEPGCLKVLKQFEGKLTQKIINEWLLLSRALDNTCSYLNKWDDKKIFEELIAEREHPVSWYVDHCQQN